jgi:lipopolysaccharide export system permease protein
VLSFSTHDLPIDFPRWKFRGAAGEREYVLPELLKIGWGQGASDHEKTVVMASLNYRLVEVVMILMLPLLAGAGCAAQAFDIIAGRVRVDCDGRGLSQGQ